MNPTDAMYLVSFACDLMAVDMPKLSFTPLDEADRDKAGKYYPKQHILFLNRVFPDRPHQIFTLFREIRHHYQYVITEKNDTGMEPAERIRSWKHDMEHYIPAEEDQDRHDRMSIEVDADAFACVMVLYIWGKFEALSERQNQEEIASRIKEIAEEYTFEEAKQIAIRNQTGRTDRIS